MALALRKPNYKTMNTINEVLREILKELTPKPKPTPAQIHRIIMEKKRAQKKLLRKKRKGAQ